MENATPMSDEPDAYQTYILRLWRTRRRGLWQWRASLECRQTGERQVFASPEQLFAYLDERCEGQARRSPDQTGTSCSRVTGS